MMYTDWDRIEENEWLRTLAEIRSAPSQLPRREDDHAMARTLLAIRNADEYEGMTLDG